MRNILYCVPILALLSCSEKISTPPQGQTEQDRIVRERRADVVIVESDEKIINNDYSRIRSVVNKNEKFEVLVLDQDGAPVKAKSLSPNQTYKIKVINGVAKETLIKMGDGFSVEKTVVSKGYTTFDIKTNPDIKDNVYISFIFTYNDGGVLSKSPIKNTLLPN